MTLIIDGNRHWNAFCKLVALERHVIVSGAKTYNFCLVSLVNILRNHAESADSGDPYFGTLGVRKEHLEKLEEILDLGLEAVHDIFKDCVQNVHTNFTVGDSRRAASLLEERE